jgi:hypothetical protein
LFDYVRQSQNLFQPTEKGDDSTRPIFIVGMPRSRTTLVERILSNHTAVNSCGELQDFGVAVKEMATKPSQKVLDIETLKVAQNIDFSALGRRYIQRIASQR